MIKAEVQWLQRNDLTRLDYDATVRQTRLNRGKRGKLPNGRICYFCTRKVTRSRVFGTVKPIKCQCNKYTEISAFSHMLQIK